MSEDVLIISAIIQAIATVVLVGVTIFYAYSTAKMTKIVSKEFEYSFAPYATIDRTFEIFTDVDPRNPDHQLPFTTFFQVKFNIINVGKVPLKYIASVQHQDEISNVGVHIALFPGQVLHFTSDRFHIERVDINQLIQEFTLSIEYFSLSDSIHKYYFKRTIRINGSNHTILLDDAGEIKK
ncbi:MAG: hypothetical protein V2A54_12530 [Bacteroidota bacterium]